MTDRTRYVVAIDGQVTDALTKNRAVLKVVKHLLDHGHSPEEIACALEATPRHSYFIRARGHLTSNSFMHAKKEGAKSFSPRKWFCNDDELLHFRDWTYSFYSQWTDATMHHALELLNEQFVHTEITWEPAS